ncbi:MAG TPA: hypothetical protein VKT70_00605, partial [Stellaceae bacterium]|nr:hypothetical protein [Stellaceae bacterium]
MKMRTSLKTALALGSFTAAAALLVGLSTASAQQPAAPGAGSFPGSFLVPGTNTSILIGGAAHLTISDDFSAHA